MVQKGLLKIAKTSLKRKGPIDPCMLILISSENGKIGTKIIALRLTLVTDHALLGQSGGQPTSIKLMVTPTLKTLTRTMRQPTNMTSGSLDPNLLTNLPSKAKGRASKNSSDARRMVALQSGFHHEH